MQLQRLMPEPPAPDADWRTRLRAATRSLDELLGLFARWQSTVWWATGIIQGLDPDATEAEQEEALERIARYLARRWRVADPRVRIELARRVREQGTSWSDVKRQSLHTAIWLTLRDDLNRPQALRFRPEGWLLDEAGHKLVQAPVKLPLLYFDRWFYSHARKLAEVQLLDLTQVAYEQAKAHSTRMQTPTSLPADDGNDVVSDADADPLYLLLERESGENTATLYAKVWQYATPAQRRLLAEYRVQLDNGGSLAAAARATGMAEGTAYAQLNRLRATLRNRGTAR